MSLKKCWAVSLFLTSSLCFAGGDLSTASDLKQPESARYQALMRAAKSMRRTPELLATASRLRASKSYILRSAALRVLALEGDHASLRKTALYDQALLLRKEALEYLARSYSVASRDLLLIAEDTRNRSSSLPHQALALLGKRDLTVEEQRRYSALVRELDPPFRSRASRTPALGR